MWASGQGNVQKTVDCVTFLAKTIGNNINILEVTNEPAGFLGDDFTRVLKQYYIDAYNAIRGAAGDALGVMLSDGFRGIDVNIHSIQGFAFETSTESTLQYWGSSFNAPEYQGTSMDIVRDLSPPVLTHR
jgi:aryl-phospho-beta-D-glucosidase BglC (GH1 family)